MKSPSCYLPPLLGSHSVKWSNEKMFSKWLMLHLVLPWGVNDTLPCCTRQTLGIFSYYSKSNIPRGGGGGEWLVRLVHHFIISLKKSMTWNIPSGPIIIYFTVLSINLTRFRFISAASEDSIGEFYICSARLQKAINTWKQRKIGLC